MINLLVSLALCCVSIPNAKAECLRTPDSCKQSHEYLDNVLAMVNMDTTCRIDPSDIRVIDQYDRDDDGGQESGNSRHGEFKLQVDRTMILPSDGSSVATNGRAFSILLNYKRDLSDQTKKLLAVVNSSLPFGSPRCQFALSRSPMPVEWRLGQLTQIIKNRILFLCKEISLGTHFTIW